MTVRVEPEPPETVGRVASWAVEIVASWPAAMDRASMLLKATVLLKVVEPTTSTVSVPDTPSTISPAAASELPR